MRLFLLALFMIGPAQAYADSVTFRVDQVQGTFRTMGVEIRQVQGFLDCRFINDSGNEVLHPKELLNTEWHSAPTTQSEYVYFDLLIHAGKLWDFKFFASLASCAYRLNFEGVDPKDGTSHKGELILAGSAWNMPPAELSTLLTREDLATIIMRKIRLLTVYINPQSGEISAVSQ